MRILALLVLVLAACSDGESEREQRLKEARALVGKLAEPAAFQRAVELAEIEPLLTAAGSDDLACLALGRIGGAEARARLEEIAASGRRVGYAALEARTPAEWSLQQERDVEAADLLAGEDEGAFARAVELRAVGPLVQLTGKAQPDRKRHLACVALGRIGGPEARDRLLALLAAPTPEPARDGAVRLYAAVGLTLLKDAGTAVDLLLQLSAVNPNDNVAALAAEGTTGPYYTVDAQICEALLAMGLWSIEDELVAQLRRHDYVRVLIDAHAVLRRHTGLELPFRYNGAYADKEADADRWLARLRETRAEREARRPFDADNPRFRERCVAMMRLLGGKSVNDRYVAEKVVVRLGRIAIPFLVDGLESSSAVAQREAALMLGRIGHADGAPALRKALALEDADARASAIDALGKIRDAGARELVEQRLLDSDAEVRANAANFLAGFGNETSRGALARAVESERAPATSAAMRCALLSLGDESQVPALLEIFVQGEQHDREASLAALRAVGHGEWQADALAPPEERAAAAKAFRKR